MREFEGAGSIEKAPAFFLLLLPLSIFTERSIIDICFTMFALTALTSLIVSKLKEFQPLNIRTLTFPGNKKSILLLCFMLFWVTCLFSSFFSTIPATALKESLAWVRFPIFVIACLFWLCERPALFKLFITISLVCFLGFCLISYTEFVFNFMGWSVADKGDFARLSWPYGDAVIGSVFGKFFLGPIVVLSVWMRSAQGKAKIAFHIILLLWITALILTGERINLLIGFWCILGVLAVSGSVTVKELTIGVFFCGLLVMSVALLNNLYLLKYFNFLQQILDIRNTGYGHLWASGLLIWQENFWFGAGTATYRDLCSTYQEIIPAINRCDNHPHNYFVQLLAETGIVGFVGFLALYSALVWNAVSTKGPSIGIWVIPLIFFFPLQSTGDFFGQWFNIMMWFTIGVTLCFVEIYQKDARQ